jgi:hypothetical protein
MDAYFLTETQPMPLVTYRPQAITRSDDFTAQDASDVAIIDLQAIKTT